MVRRDSLKVRRCCMISKNVIVTNLKKMASIIVRVLQWLNGDGEGDSRDTS